jgi:hypothetical protein
LAVPVFEGLRLDSEVDSTAVAVLVVVDDGRVVVVVLVGIGRMETPPVSVTELVRRDTLLEGVMSDLMLIG